MISTRNYMKAYKYLIRVPNHLGDCIMAQPAIRGFVETRQNDSIALMLPEWAVPIYSEFRNLDMMTIPANRLHGFMAILYQSERMQEHKIDAGIVLTPSFSSALALFLGGVKRRYGLAGDGRRWLLNHPVIIPDKVLHRSQQYKHLLEQAAGTTLGLPRPALSLDDFIRKRARELLEINGINTSDKYAVIAPQAIAESRRWGTNNYAILSSRTIDRFKTKIALIGTSDEITAGEEIARNNDGIVNLCGKTDIGLAAAVLSGASMFIGNDSGLAHLASSVDIPLVVLSGADNPEETSPISDKKTVVIKDNLECISCVKNRCPLKGDGFMQCMREISVEEVMQAVAKYLE